MKEFKGTPGPWTGKDVGICKQDDAGLQLGFIMTFNDERRAECAANAHLIAAAPELLEALQELLNEYESIVSHEFNSSCLDVDPDYLRAKAAIVKALGETK